MSAGNFTVPIEAGFGRYMGGFYAQIVPDTKALEEFCGRGLAKSIVWAPGRMVDKVEDMLAAWRKNDTSGTDRATPFVPIMIAAMSRDYIPAPAEFSRGMSDHFDVSIPGDPMGRALKLRVAVADVRCQVAIVAPEKATARSLAMQFNLYVSALRNRRFYAEYTLAGVGDKWPVVLELPEFQAIATDTEAKNVTILVADLQMRASIPVLMSPGAAQPNDGQGAGTYENPHGYPVVTEANVSSGPNADTLTTVVVTA